MKNCGECNKVVIEHLRSVDVASIYLFETDGQMVWCDADKSDGRDAVKYIRSDLADKDIFTYFWQGVLIGFGTWAAWALLFYIMG